MRIFAIVCIQNFKPKLLTRLCVQVEKLEGRFSREGALYLVNGL